MLDATLARTRGAFTLDVALRVGSGEVFVLTGESGAGKTTVLRLLAGLIVPDIGTIALDGDTYFGPGTLTVPAWQRDIGYVPQDHALFPHLSARENVAFGLRAAGCERAEAEARVDGALTRFAVTPFASRRPHQLSGGQQQRVALARALVLEPKLLLLDEPLSALDRASRGALRDELRNLLRGRPGVTILVTHSDEEARALGDTILTIDAGRIIL